MLVIPRCGLDVHLTTALGVFGHGCSTAEIGGLLCPAMALTAIHAGRVAGWIEATRISRQGLIGGEVLVPAGCLIELMSDQEWLKILEELLSTFADIRMLPVGLPTEYATVVGGVAALWSAVPIVACRTQLWPEEVLDAALLKHGGCRVLTELSSSNQRHVRVCASGFDTGTGLFSYETLRPGIAFGFMPCFVDDSTSPAGGLGMFRMSVDGQSLIPLTERYSEGDFSANHQTEMGHANEELAPGRPNAANKVLTKQEIVRIFLPDMRHNRGEILDALVAGDYSHSAKLTSYVDTLLGMLNCDARGDRAGVRAAVDAMEAKNFRIVGFYPLVPISYNDEITISYGLLSETRGERADAPQSAYRKANLAQPSAPKCLYGEQAHTMQGIGPFVDPGGDEEEGEFVMVKWSGRLGFSKASVMDIFYEDKRTGIFRDEAGSPDRSPMSSPWEAGVDGGLDDSMDFATFFRDDAGARRAYEPHLRIRDSVPWPSPLSYLSHSPARGAFAGVRDSVPWHSPSPLSYSSAVPRESPSPRSYSFAPATVDYPDALGPGALGPYVPYPLSYSPVRSYRGRSPEWEPRGIRSNSSSNASGSPRFSASPVCTPQRPLHPSPSFEVIYCSTGEWV